MDFGTTLAIIVPNLVAALAIWIGWKAKGRELRQARRLYDLGSIRTVLDDAAVELHTTADTLDRVGMDLSQCGQGFFTTEERTERFTNLEEAGRRLDALAERLKVRLGASHELVRAFVAAGEATLEIYRALARIKREPDADTGDQYAQEQVRNLFQGERTAIEAARERFNTERDAFIAAAARTAGADLPSDA